MGLLTSKEFVLCHFYFPHSFVGTWLSINNALGEICHFMRLSCKAHLGFPNACMHCSIHSIWCPTPFWIRTNIFTYVGHQMIAQVNSILTGYWRTILRNQSHGFPLLPHCPHFLTISRLSFLAFFAWSSWVKPHALWIIKQLILEACIASHDSVDMETLSLAGLMICSLWLLNRQ